MINNYIFKWHFFAKIDRYGIVEIKIINKLIP
jgi:hypothetical protein